MTERLRNIKTVQGFQELSSTLDIFEKAKVWLHYIITQESFKYKFFVVDCLNDNLDAWSPNGFKQLPTTRIYPIGRVYSARSYEAFINDNIFFSDWVMKFHNKIWKD